MTYNPQTIEEKWIARWEEEGTHQPDIQNAKRPYYNLMMFPYPSATGLHVGNMYSFVGSDVHGRFKRAQGYDVFQPMGFDAFGIHSENYAIKTDAHPVHQVPESIKNFRRQLQRIGAIFDWSHEVTTTSPEYYRWTQWVFVQLFNAGLIYQQESPVNWCPDCKTVLSNEMAEAGICERCDAHVEQRSMVQWFARITAYAQRLLDNLESMDWSPSTIKRQRGWIGRTEDENGDVSYRLHDWCISRQRYWGTPIPIVHCPDCGAVPVPEEQLPVEHPYIEDFHPDGSGKNPLARSAKFVQTSCPQCGATAERETDVCDNFLDSSWYFLRYPSSDDSDLPFDRGITHKWCPVSMYVGGDEHAFLHLMYARFVTMALHDAGHIDFEEPFTRFTANGMITKDGKKIGKRLGNSIDPDAAIAQYGSDAFRMKLMSMGPFTQNSDYSDDIVGIQRFMDRVWAFFEGTSFDDAPMSANMEQMVHTKTKAVTDAIEGFRYNSAIARVIEYAAAMQAMEPNRTAMTTFIRLIAPFAPCMAQEMWDRIAEAGMVIDAPWPTWDEQIATGVRIQIPVQVDGKVRGRIEVDSNTEEEEIRRMTLADARIQQAIGGRTVERIVVVPGRVVNVVVGTVR